MASSSSYHQQNWESNAFSGLEPAGKRTKVSESSRVFDVFINHRGPDVKQTLATDLYNSLRRSGIEAFLDSEEKELGISFPSTIESAVSSAKVHIAIFSPRYAESAWCLAELVLMLQSQAKIIPLFYEVKPWELRHIEKGAYAAAFSTHKEKGSYLEKLSEWKEALNKVSFIAGVEFYSDCKTVVAAVEEEVQRKRCLYVAKYPVGLNNLVKDFENRCLDKLVQDFENQCGLGERNNKPIVVAILGMGGLGKTTLAMELFNRKCSYYSRASFLFDVREAAVRSELPHLQSQLVKDLLQREQHFRSIEEGKTYLNDHLRRSPLNFLVVIDDIDHVEQLDALLIMDIFNKLGDSLVIVTTRDDGVAISAGITRYPLKGMDRDNGRLLFCWHAFDQCSPFAGYEALVEQFLDVCGGLPLSLLVLGRLVHGRDQKFWESNLVKARKTLPRDVKERLKITFDALEDEEKQVFMDIACFFLGKPKSMAKKIFEGSGWGAETALQTLKDKCLIEEVTYHKGLYVLRMHDHLRDLGREMADEVNHPRRLWRRQDLEDLRLMGSQSILAKINARCLHSIWCNSMNCQFTFFLGQSDICVETSPSLLWLELEYKRYMIPPSWTSLPAWIPLQQYMIPPSWTSLPAWIPLQHLQCLRIVGGSLKHCGRITQWYLVSRLKYHLETGVVRAHPKRGDRRCRTGQNPSPVTLPTTFVSLFIHNCKGLQRVSGSGDLIKVTNLRISSCPKLEELPSFSGVSCVEDTQIENCDKLQNITLPPKLTTLSIKKCRDLQRVVGSGVQSCRDLKRVSGSADLIKLTNLRISSCPKLEELPSFSGVSCVEDIQIENCDKLQNITLPPTLTTLFIKRCRDLQRVVGSGVLTNMIICHCSELEDLSSFSRLSCMNNINIEQCEKLQNITLPTALTSLYVQSCRDLKRVLQYGDLRKLTKLIISDCPELEELPSFSRVSHMEKIQIGNCDKLPNITLPPKLTTLSIKKCRDLQRVVGSGVQSCRDMKRVSGSADLIKLTNLRISSCPKLEELPSFSGVSCVEDIQIENCDKLQNITLPPTLTTLFIKRCRYFQRVVGSGVLTNMIICHCSELEDLSSFSRLSCMKNIEIEQCEKLQNITLPTALTSLYVQSCRDLKRVLQYGDLRKLTELIISDCPELEELPSFSRVSHMEKIQIGNCDKLPNITFPPTLTSLSIKNCRDLQRAGESNEIIKLTEPIITDCPALEVLPRPSSLSSMKKLEIEYCEKLQYIMFPTTVINLKELLINYCPHLEELPSLFMSCTEKIQIAHCKTLQIITLPKTLISLFVHNCRDLKEVVGSGEPTQLTEVFINECPELEELPSLSKMIYPKNIEIDSSENLERIPTIEELHALEYMQLSYCSNAAIRNCIHNLKNAPRKLYMIGKAADGAESSLNESLFSSTHIGANAFTEIVTRSSGDLDFNEWCKNSARRKLYRSGKSVDGSVSRLDESLFSDANSAADAQTEIVTHSNSHMDINEWCQNRAAVIMCLVVVADSCTSAEDINKFLQFCDQCKSLQVYDDSYAEIWPKILEGEWIITMVAQDNWRHVVDFQYVADAISRNRVMKKGFLLEVEKGEESKCLSVLRIIVDRLHQ